jgi:hypothetical protein
MTIGNSVRKTTVVWIATGVLLLAPSASRAHRFEASNLLGSLSWQDPQAAQEKEQERLEREQEAREKEQEKREREQEAREQVQERVEQLQELYDDGREDLDEERYDQAEAKFKQLAEMNGPQTDAALYWKAYAQNRQGKREAAIGTIAELKKRFPQSHWQKDASALEIEVRQSSGQKPNPEAETNKDLKLYALQALLRSDPERAMPLVEKMLNDPGSPKDKAKVLFMAAQSGSPQAQELMTKVALGQSNPELQRKAVEYLGIFGGVGGGVEGGVQGGVSGGVSGPNRSRGSAKQVLAEVYSSSSDAGVKRAVLRSYMLSGDRQSLLAAAKSEKDEGLKREAIRQLGLTGGLNELQQLYQGEASTETRREILQGFFLAGDSRKLVQVAQTDKDPELRRTAIRNMGLMGGKEPELRSIYEKETDRNVKEEVLNAYFLGGNASGLVAIARNEKDHELKKKAVEKLSLMGSKEANDYLMELLQK